MAEFFHKKKAVIACLCSLVLVVVCLLQAYRFEKATQVVGKAFYFLLERTENAETCAVLSYQKGGAGYVFSENFVAHACYLEESSAQTVCEKLSATKKTEIVKVGGEILYQTRGKEDAFKGVDTLCKCIRILSDVADGLTQSLTQEKADGLLKDVERVLFGLQKRFEGKEDGLASLCAEIKRWSEKAREGIIYAKDLRYIACFAALNIVELEKEYGA